MNRILSSARVGQTQGATTAKSIATAGVLLSCLGWLGGCGRTESGKDRASTSGATPAAAAARAPAGGTQLAEVDLSPLPLTIKVPPGGMGAMDLTMAGVKSVTVDIGEGASINVNEEKRDLAGVKKSYKGDTILFPFKKWVKEEGNLAIVQFDISGKTGFIGFVLKEVAGKKYLCKTTGVDGVASPEVAMQNLKHCDALTAK